MAAEWRADCNRTELGVGAHLSIYRSQQYPGRLAEAFLGYHQIVIRLGDLKMTPAEIENAGLTTATLKMPSGVLYEITPRRGDEVPSGARGFGECQDWVVRREIAIG